MEKKKKKVKEKQSLADFKPLRHSFPSEPPSSLSSFFLSVNMSGEEHKKGRVSELEGQQRGLWESHVSFVRAPEGGSERGEGGVGAGEGKQEWSGLFFVFNLKSAPANEIMRAECFDHPALGLSTSAAFTEEAFLFSFLFFF